jgi:hypothetical protein
VTDLEFDSLIASVAEERDSLVLEGIVCHFANAGDVEALKEIQVQEGAQTEQMSTDPMANSVI